MSKLQDIGRLKYRVDFKSLTRTTNSTGGFTEAWTVTAASVWAAIEITDAAEQIRGEQQEQKQIVKLKIRFRSDINAKMRAVLPSSWGSKVVRITGIKTLDDEQRFQEVKGEVIDENA